jgi:spermidine synthase
MQWEMDSPSDPAASEFPAVALPGQARRGLTASLLLLLFFSSGCAALIYEIVWFQLLEFVIGSTAISLAVLLGTFMGGMCLGSLALPRLVSPRRHPLRVCAFLELGIGVLGIAVLFGMPQVVRLFGNAAGHGPGGILLRGGICALCLLPPTVLMGATLPAISRWLESTPRGISWLGFLYGGNTIGAVFGCLLAGFYLLRVHDMPTATWIAAAINLAAALLGFSLAAWAPPGPGPREPAVEPIPPAPNAAAVHFAIALSGMSALGAEVVWTRLMALMLGPTVYTFSIILSVFLLGLGLGGSIGGFLARSLARPRALLGGCQALLAIAIAWAAYSATKTLPYWPVDAKLAASPWLRFQPDFARCLWAILPSALLWGASFPLALAAASRPGQDPGRLVGGVYAANTVGAIAGAVLFSLLIVPRAGTQHAERVLIGLAAASALLLLAPQRGSFAGVPRIWWISAATAIAAAGLIAFVPRTPSELIAYGRTLLRDAGNANILYTGEGMNFSVAVSETFDGVRNFHVSGKIEASTTTQDMRLQRMLAHLPAMLHPAPRSVLIVGCGAGVTAGTFVVQPGIERIVICEIEPLVPRVADVFFAGENRGVVDDPRVEFVFDDARHYILTTKEKFDIITSDPIHPWVKGSASLYTREYFEMCRERLNPGGMVTQWIPLYESDEASVKSEVATFFQVFPGGTIWANDDSGNGYDVVVLGQNGPARIDMDALRKRWSSHDYEWAAASLAKVGFPTPDSLLATYAGRAAELAPWLAGAQINRDRNLRLQYLAGLGLNAGMEATIYSHMLAYCEYPEGLFFGSMTARDELQRAIDGKKSPK